MNEKEITKAAYKLLKYTNGKVCYSALCNYIQSKGFIIVELHTEKGDDLLSKLGCYEEYATEKGITVIQKAVSFVIIDSNLPTADKLHVLLHETGHIDLHLLNKSTFADISGIERESQAELFAYRVQHFGKVRYWMYKLTNKCG